MRRIEMMLFLLCFAASFMCAQEQLFVPANDISVTLTSAQKTYKRGEVIQLTYKVVNVSQHSVYVPRELWDSSGCTAHVWAWLEDSSGRRFAPPGYGGMCGGLGPTTINERMNRNAALLNPGEAYQNSFTLDTRDFRDIREPGRYRVEMTFSGWRDEQFTQAEKSAFRAMGHALLGGGFPASTTVELTF